MDIADKIQQTIECALCTKYVSGFTLEIDDDDIWCLKLNLNQSDAPLSLTYEGDESGFLNFLEKELKSRQIDRVHYFTGEQTTPGTDPQYIIYEYGNR
jgi:hypothetical protein